MLKNCTYVLSIQMGPGMSCQMSCKSCIMYIENCLVGSGCGNVNQKSDSDRAAVFWRAASRTALFGISLLFHVSYMLWVMCSQSVVLPLIIVLSEARRSQSTGPCSFRSKLLWGVLEKWCSLQEAQWLT